MKQCTFLSMDNPPQYFDDEHARAPLRELGWSVNSVSWRKPIHRDSTDAVVIRSTWDYHHHHRDFLRALERIDADGIPLLNPLPLIRQNVEKTYLRALAQAEVPVVPTEFRQGLRRGDLVELVDFLGSADLVVKPVIGASADDTFRVPTADSATTADVEARFSDRAVMVQPLVTAILTEGEASLQYFNGVFSHAVIKTPAPGDFRVQEEHGGSMTTLDPVPAYREVAQAALASLPVLPVYARVDLVRANRGDTPWLMELELIEPALFLGTHPEAPRRFARAIVDRVQKRAATA